MGEEPEEERERGAENQASHNGKVESGVFAAMHDVTGKPPQAERKLVAEIKDSAKKNDKGAEEEKRAAEFAKRIHGKILEEVGRGSQGVCSQGKAAW